MSSPNLQLVKDKEPPIKILPTRQGGDFYTDNKDACPEHKYFGQGWPINVKDVDYDADNKPVVNGCARCYEIWRLVHINPGTERAGQ